MTVVDEFDGGHRSHSRPTSDGEVFDALMWKSNGHGSSPVPKRVEDIITTNDPALIALIMREDNN